MIFPSWKSHFIVHCRQLGHQLQSVFLWVPSTLDFALSHWSNLVPQVLTFELCPQCVCVCVCVLLWVVYCFMLGITGDWVSDLLLASECQQKGRNSLYRLHHCVQYQISKSHSGFITAWSVQWNIQKRLHFMITGCVSALCFLLCFDTVDRVTGRTCGELKSLCH